MVNRPQRGSHGHAQPLPWHPRTPTTGKALICHTGHFFPTFGITKIMSGPADDDENAPFASWAVWRTPPWLTPSTPHAQRTPSPGWTRRCDATSPGRAGRYFVGGGPAAGVGTAPSGIGCPAPPIGGSGGGPPGAP